MIRPTASEIKLYAIEIGYSDLDPERFIDYYEQCGWMVGRNKPMKDWKAAVRTWRRIAKPDERQGSDRRKPALVLARYVEHRPPDEELMTAEDIRAMKEAIRGNQANSPDSGADPAIIGSVPAKQQPVDVRPDPQHDAGSRLPEPDDGFAEEVWLQDRPATRVDAE